ncbi:hypothetical protein niasHT_032099 [Heterodera trifolii]|uniref:DUF659 domain-containing protein n=1 Tax=Heterodera trifolii TaxID=157864 RepID=A0ABD2HRQ1_9BILA
MPKIQSKSAFIRDWIRKIGGEAIYTDNGKIIFCKVCEQQVKTTTTCNKQRQQHDDFSQIPCSQYWDLKQHNETAKHSKNLARFSKKKSKQQQPFLTTNENKQDQFSADLCKALVSANIPFFKLNKAVLSSFLEKYCQRTIPDQSTLRKNYLVQLFSETMTKIKDAIGKAFVWFSVDETTDKMGRMMANLLIGKLDGKKWHPPHLISVKALEKVDSGAMARFVNEGLDSFSGDIKKERVLFLVTDGAAYMKKAGKQLKVFYTNLLHVTCLCHALHRVAEKVRDEFTQVDKLISKTKQVFLKAPQRLSVYREMCPGLPIPPRPVLTRWTTWITAVSFYWEHFEELKAVVDQFNSDDAVCVNECQLSFNNSVWQDLAYIHSNFGQLATAITKLETQGMTIFDAMDVFAGVHNQMDNVYGEKANEIRKKFADIVAKNHGIEKVSQFCQILSGKNTESDVPPNLIPFYKFAPLTSCDVERSFSVYKSILADNRSSIPIQIPSNKMVEANLKNARKHGIFMREMRCQCPAKKLMATNFTKVKTTYTDKCKGVCCWFVLAISIVAFVALSVWMIIHYVIETNESLPSPLVTLAMVLFTAIIIALVFLCCNKTYFECKHTALEVLFNCDSCGHNVHRTYECFIYFVYVNYVDNRRRHRWYRYCSNKTYSPWGRYTAENVTRTVEQKPRPTTTIETVEREFIEMSGDEKDDYTTSWAWTSDLISRLD